MLTFIFTYIHTLLCFAFVLPMHIIYIINIMYVIIISISIFIVSHYDLWVLFLKSHSSPHEHRELFISYDKLRSISK